MELLGGPKPETILTPDESLKDSDVKATRWQGKHLLFGEFVSPSYPVAFSRTPVSNRQCAPMLGEHTNKLLSEVGFSSAEIATMLESKAAISTKSKY